MSTNTTTRCLSVLQRPSSASDTVSLRAQKSVKPFFHCGGKKKMLHHNSFYCVITLPFASKALR